MGLSGNLLYIIVLGFPAGIVASSFLHDSNIFLWVSLVVLVVLGIFCLFRKNFLVILLLAFTLSLSVGFVRNNLTLFLNSRPTELDQFVKEKITLVGVLVEDQERRDFNTRLTVLVQEINNEKVSEGFGLFASGQEKILVTTGNPKVFRYGDVVRLRGELIRPENFYTDTGREFDYVGYLKANDIRFLMRNASVETVRYDPPSKIIASLFFAKRKFVESIGKMLPEPQSSLASGILIDGKQSINGELQEKFRKTGLVHIVVLSGYNVSIVAEAIGKSLSFLPRSLGLGSSVVGIVAFAMITGASATVVRASIMAILVLLSRFSLRNYDPARGLFIASFLMLIHNPTILLHSPSFQLSFLATFAVVKVIPTFENWAESVGQNGPKKWNGGLLRFIPEKFGLRELVVSNIIVQLFLFPILTWMTGFFSAVSLPVNLLVLPLIPLTMLVAFLTALAGFFGRYVGLPFAFVAETLLSYELSVVNFFSKFSLAEISFSGFSGTAVAGFYIFMIVWFIFFVKKPVKPTKSVN